MTHRRFGPACEAHAVREAVQTHEADKAHEPFVTFEPVTSRTRKLRRANTELTVRVMAR